ncbi:hypothetical protein A2870_02730 [Candidatus Curtissbacteria bacterium RIFCSPHIGHO2_01_FULL_41_11]|uniref:Uncharacterized protein n=1 Tax=Candidatus Curtissbacteria bacterium RIFCSPHIGHO2_01_FULL_41_11 TaxID=1797711 RepID=A0A1F5G4E2_9BACT|nr:MAG: hypothetical protein A2870_02730 [Candidatus Curtissbacteria bacterium RIFCSPHIGHO2_01_FULL_41_11]
MNLLAIYNEFKSRVAFWLLLIWILAFIVQFRTLNYLLYPLFAVGLMTVLDLGITWIRSRKLYWPSASFVTGALIGLIIDPRAPVWIIAVAVSAAFVSKQFINRGIRQHIFNPAAFGIMTVSVVFGIPIAWWSVAWGKLPLVILVPAMIWVLWRMKRVLLPVGFIAIYFFYYLTIFDPKTALMSLLDGSLLLFALVMLPEPITSPIVGKFKYFFGASVALVSIAISKFGLGEVFLPALLIANLGAFLIRQSSSSKL